jgi:hypothetical protein
MHKGQRLFWEPLSMAASRERINESDSLKTQRSLRRKIMEDGDYDAYTIQKKSLSLDWVRLRG